MKLSPQEILPHRDPFLFVDEILEADESTRWQSGSSPRSFLLQRAFPDYPVVPGVLLIETMAQAGGAGLGQAGIIPLGSLFVLATIEKAKFRSQVRPGDEAVITVENVRISQMVLRQKGTITVNGTVAAEASWMCILVKGEE